MGCTASQETSNTSEAAKPGFTLVSLTKDRTSRAPTKRTTRLNATCTTTNGRIARAGAEVRPPLAFSEVIGSTLDARNAGASPSNALLSKVIPLINATNRQSTRKSSNTGSSVDLSRLTTAGAATISNATP